MSVDERSRLQLAEALKRTLGDDEGITLMELLPPVGWADVATKHDLLMVDARFDSLEVRLDARFELSEGRMDARFQRLEARFDGLEGRFDGLESSLDARFERSELKMEAKYERGFRPILVTTASLMVSGFLATIVAVIAR